MPMKPAIQTLERRIQLAIRFAPEWLISTGCVHARDTMVLDQSSDDLNRISPPQNQTSPPFGNVMTERGQGMMQPPTAGRAGPLVQNINQKSGRAGLCGRMQSGVVGQPKIIAKPDQPHKILRLRHHLFPGRRFFGRGFFGRWLGCLRFSGFFALDGFFATLGECFALFSQ